MANETEVKPKKRIPKWLWVIGGIFIFIIIIVIAGGGGEKKEAKPEITQPTQEEITQPPQTEIQKPENQEQPKTEAPAQPEATWQEVKSWQGTGTKNTELFTIIGEQWRIIWSIEDTTGFGGSILQVFVYKAGGELPLEIVANAQGTASDTGYIYKSGEFYLNVNSANGNWAITVEELK